MRRRYRRWPTQRDLIKKMARLARSDYLSIQTRLVLVAYADDLAAAMQRAGSNVTWLRRFTSGVDEYVRGECERILRQASSQSQDIKWRLARMPPP